MRAAAAAGVVRAGGSANLDDLYVLFKDDDPRPALAALKELERVPSEEATKLIARLARRPQHDVQKMAADMLVRRNARDYFSSLKPYLDPKGDPELRRWRSPGVDEPALQAAAGRHGAGPRASTARAWRAASASRRSTGSWRAARSCSPTAGRGDGRLADLRRARPRPRTSRPRRRRPAEPGARLLRRRRRRRASRAAALVGHCSAAASIACRSRPAAGPPAAPDRGQAGIRRTFVKASYPRQCARPRASRPGRRRRRSGTMAGMPRSR